MTSSLYDESGTGSDKPPLGQLLVDAGLLTLADLEEVLAKQRGTALPLGRMLVDGGYVAAHSVAMALADQHGGLLKSEYGFATGRAGTGLRSVRGVEERTVDDLAPGVSAAAPDLTLELRRAGLPAVESPQRAEAAPVGLADVPPQMTDATPAEPAGDELRAQAEAALAALQARNEDLQARHDELEPRYTELGARNEELEARFRAVELARGGALEAAAEADRRTAEAEKRNRVHAAALASVLSSLDDALARLQAGRSDREASSPRVWPDDWHVLFVPTLSGYSLLERRGPAPAVGSEVETPSGERFEVMRVGPSPLPGEAHACAYLDRIGVTICGPAREPAPST